MDRPGYRSRRDRANATLGPSIAERSLTERTAYARGPHVLRDTSLNG